MRSPQINVYLFQLFFHFCYWLAMVHNLGLLIANTWDTWAIEVIVNLYDIECKGYQQLWYFLYGFNLNVIVGFGWFRVAVELLWIIFSIKVSYFGEKLRYFNDFHITGMSHFLIPDSNLFISAYKMS